MAKDNMTIRLTLDGFSYAECPDSASVLLDDAPFHAVAPGPDFQQRLHEQLLELIPAEDTLRDITCQIVSTRIIILPSGITDHELAVQMYQMTLSPSDTEEEVMLQPIALPSGQEVTLCFGIERELYLFMMRNFGEVCFEHHIATLLTQAARMASGNCLVVRCDSQYLELALFRQGKLDVVNVYRATHTDNRSYYIMNTWIQQQLDQLQDNLLVISQNTESLQVRASMHRFIKHVFG